MNRMLFSSLINGWRRTLTQILDENHFQLMFSYCKGLQGIFDKSKSNPAETVVYTPWTLWPPPMGLQYELQVAQLAPKPQVVWAGHPHPTWEGGLEGGLSCADLKASACWNCIVHLSEGSLLFQHSWPCFLGGHAVSPARHVWHFCSTVVGNNRQW